MCGLAGIVSTSLTGDRIQAPLQRMTHAMKRRGPDGNGLKIESSCGLAHTRLAIIDTSTNGAQPMTRAGVTLVYNGELYNFQHQRKLLEAKGYQFVGQSDAEVLLALYLHYKEACVHHLRGMYAFAIWDSHRQTLFCARDPLGIKPFLYTATSQGLIFASSIKALLASQLVECTVDRNALRALLERGSIPQPTSILRGVSWLLPGYSLTIKPGELPVVDCFRPLRTQATALNGTEWASIKCQGENLLREAVRQQLVADVPIGAFLSGGIDSSLLVALMAQEHSNLRTFSVGFEGGLTTDSEDETADAAVVAKHLGVDHCQVLVREQDVADNLPAVVSGLDHPTVDGVNSWFVAQAASQDLTVAISGTGGDELFAGYPWFGAMQTFAQQPWTQRLKQRFQGVTFQSTFDAQYRIFDGLTASALCPETSPPGPRPDPLSQADPLSRVTGMLLSGYTRDQLLADIDTAAMHHSLEVRVPLLDEALLDFALSVPAMAKVAPPDAAAPAGSYAASGVKRLLVEIGEPLLPEGFADRAKRGFSLPFDSWLRGILLPVMKELLSEETTRRRGFFDPGAVQSVVEGFLAGRLHWTRPWLLMMTELWAQEVLDA